MVSQLWKATEVLGLLSGFIPLMLRLQCKHFLLKLKRKLKTNANANFYSGCVARVLCYLKNVKSCQKGGICLGK